MMRPGFHDLHDASSERPARRAWSIFSLVFGEVLEMRFVQEHEGNPAGFWRVRFYDSATGKKRVRYVPVQNLGAISDDQIRTIRALLRKAKTVTRQAEAAKMRLLKAKLALADEEPGPLTAEVVTEHRRGKTVRAGSTSESGGQEKAATGAAKRAQRTRILPAAGTRSACATGA